MPLKYEDYKNITTLPEFIINHCQNYQTFSSFTHASHECHSGPTKTTSCDIIMIRNSDRNTTEWGKVPAQRSDKCTDKD